MRLSINGFVALLLLGMIHISCDRVKPVPPMASTLDSTLVVPVSTINIPIHYEVAKLEQIVNEKVKGTFIREQFKVNEKEDSLFIEVEKKGPIALSWQSPTLYYSVPVKVSGKFIKHFAGIRIRNAQPVEMEMVLHFATALAIDKRWNLALTSRLDEIKWIRDPQLKVGMVKINLKKQVEQALERKKETLIPRMDDALSALLDTRKIILKLWKDIQKPVRVNKKETQVWLKAYATGMMARLVDEGPDRITLDVQLKSRITTLLEGEEVPASNDKLPPFRKKEAGADSLQMFVHVLLPFERANQLLNKALEGKKIASEGYSTTIRKVELYGTPIGLALKLKVRGDVDGQVYITTTPAFDTLERRVYAGRFAFDVDTENALVNSADWLLHEHALDVISQQLQLDVQPYVDLLPDLIMQGIEKGKVGEKIDLTISQLSIKPVQFLITRDNFQIIFAVTGKADIGLEQKVFARKKKKKTAHHSQ